jgi:conjugative transposon TraM protein
MTLKEINSKVNWRQTKYVLPALVYPFLLAAGYPFMTFGDVQLAEKPSEMQTTEYLNSELPQAQLNNDGIGGKYENMEKSYGKIQDYSAVENIERDDNTIETEDYDSKYTDADLAFLDSEAEKRLQELQDQLDASRRRGEAMSSDSIGSQNYNGDRSKLLEDLNKALADARLKGQKGMEETIPTAAVSTTAQNKVEVNENAVNELSDDDTAGAVVKKIRTNSDYFNTLADNESEAKMIKAIIDENITAVDGSRVRLRLLDDVEINEVVLPKGSYIYATMSGFGSQRVKGNIKSLMVDDELVKVSLSIYDTDGLEGLYVPSSSFRETSQDIASSALSSNVSMNNSSYNNSFSQWGMQAIQNAYQRTTNAISKAVKKNKAKLKYGTFVYLVNAKDTKNK